MEEAQRRIAKEDFHAWKNDPVTKTIIARMNQTVEFIKQQWYSGEYKEEGNDFWMGFANGCHEFLRVELYEDVPAPPGKGLKE